MLMDSDLAKEMALYGITQQAGELEEYTHEGSTLITCKTEPPELMYWRSQAERWPNLTNMARDYLAIPVTSTPAGGASPRLSMSYHRKGMPSFQHLFSD